jgi:hypothetical protein
MAAGSSYRSVLSEGLCIGAQGFLIELCQLLLKLSNLVILKTDKGKRKNGFHKN